MTYGLSGDAKQIIAALKSERDRVKGQLEERTKERDRARDIAVELEQQLAKVQEEIEDLQRFYEERYFATGTPEAEHAKSAADDCWSSMWVAMDVLSGDLFEANHLKGDAA